MPSRRAHPPSRPTNKNGPAKARSAGLQWGRILLVAALTVLAIPSCVEAQRGYPALRTRQGPYEMQVLVNGSPARTFHQRGETYLLGQQGDRYTIRIINNSDRRIEAVVSVDGRDVLDGGRASFRDKRGYLVSAFSHVDIDGWRMSSQEVAAFRFSSVADSYAAATGSAREVGVIGVAVFPEQAPPVVVYQPPPYIYEEPRPYPYRPYPYDDGYSLSDEANRGGRNQEAPSAAPPAGAGANSADSAGEGVTGAYRTSPRARSGAGHAQGSVPRPESRPGLGTEYGERRYSSVSHVQFVRANPAHPAATLGSRYNDRDGLIALGIDVDRDYRYGYSEEYLRRSATPFPTEANHQYARPPVGWRWR